MKFCLFYRTWAGLWLGEEHRLPGWVNRHIGGCADCTARLAREQELTRQLRASSGPKLLVVPPFLITRVLTKLDPGSRTSAARVLDWARYKPAAFSVLGLALLLLAMILVRNQPRNHARTPAVAQGTEGADFLAAFKPEAANWATWGEAAERSYEKELQLAMEDGRRVLSSLLQHFAPATTADAWLFPASRQPEPGSSQK